MICHLAAFHISAASQNSIIGPCLEQHHLVWHAHLKLAFVNENAHTPEEKVQGELTKMLAYLQQSLPCVALQGSKAQVGL